MVVFLRLRVKRPGLNLVKTTHTMRTKTGASNHMKEVSTIMVSPCLSPKKCGGDSQRWESLAPPPVPRRRTVSRPSQSAARVDGFSLPDKSARTHRHAILRVGHSVTHTHTHTSTSGGSRCGRRDSNPGDRLSPPFLLRDHRIGKPIS